MFKFSRFSRFLIAVALFSVGVFAVGAYATHSWGNYHWARTANPLVLKLGDNVSSSWDAYLAAASSDWNASSVLSTTVVPGRANPKNCRATSGRVEVCNSKYGNNGWLGIASIWATGDHITKGTVKLNDTYFNTAKYNTPAWRQFVACQEVGHTFGLDHQDEVFTNTNLGTCMDYTNDPAGTLYGQLNNVHPNAHDYEELGIIYAHLDTFTSAFNKTASAQARDVDESNPSEWGKVVRKSHDGRASLYERNLGNGNKLFTFVIWAD
ncbi:MAG: hypothetical protein A3H69_06055 [Candidatus Sungbacteria bacterium RIFCSPLOWO2_02_FULL_47_9]|uniref:Peptidase M10 metallopeptidase domain-containing protein n=1 Tax=Candidatus Sungbacteria bacterium RIFCSPHIGHO2_01_FULL_47_32 TaxID=1802264 RepID=A0A1G2KA70_9BACT|nr:MAG: hypothetical protein UX72_C0012G0034 [Parcubacteria group bacterium GW2011_GWA2_47_10]OGZ95431.1 MAG: hypothetical protein A2633_05915 [Candidatus Sungbacteria bacterium RIFCSPHIGHO2_01_FULL_47_32]OGZ99589.1 MAG: hypothetical protein A3D57_01385 [Candidatus Sungbacteria bacterium RIFCSPHIGHO2_02_FULL_46_12]OHA06287.1 MAG: hypothetical protein A3A28_02235 [Candidatus Sungbacteria bacterium RIFCSPLOWO2_01_FULL_47_32]OHA09564.1 MAG: hypothetical protein A3H69_06055 [Candidatus Sungbacteria